MSFIRNLRKKFNSPSPTKNLIPSRRDLSNQDLIDAENAAYLKKIGSMVQDMRIVQIDVAFMTYAPEHTNEKPSVVLDGVCVAGLFELQQHKELKRREKYQLGCEAYNHYKWYNSTLQMELYKDDKEHSTKLQIYHWAIQSSNKDAFTMNGTLYKAVSVIISPSKEYWFCANPGSGVDAHIFGCRDRPLAQQQSPSAVPVQEVLPKFVCTVDFCANNCEECRSLTTPHKHLPNPTCACYMAKKLDQIQEEAETVDEDDEIKSTKSEASASLLAAMATWNEKRNILLCNGDKVCMNNLNANRHTASTSHEVS